MSSITLLLSLLFTALFVVGVYLFGKKIGVPSTPNPEKMAPYTCGEDIPTAQPRYFITWFYYVVYFTLFEVAAMLLTISFGAAALWGPLIYVIMTFLAILILPKGEMS
ncbi:MAG: NADH-quinone oxidoreductase subunit A [Candidatus Asgardarchaeia archaeon]